MNRKLNLVFLAAICTAFCVVTFSAAAQRQRRRPPTSRPSTQTRARIDYSRFSHATEKHRGACNTCHRLPTKNWKEVRDFPDVADFPGHDACVSCHRPQFFKGAKPVICSVCHSKVSPRDDARFLFPNPVTPQQFLTEFPHDKHQDVIAKLFQRETPFVKASFMADDKHYNNCEICHSPRTANPASPWPDAFVPDTATFKTAPSTHGSCFNCHWKAQQPTGTNCGGCHKLSEKPALASDTITRISLKFRHGREQHIAECTTCHINITKSATLRGLKPDVPITACSECHNREGLRQDVSKELEALDRNKAFVCSYCHTSDVGRRDAPRDHYLIANREPVKRGDIK
jgi:hypothetical protein